jgi:hypothetical protein
MGNPKGPGNDLFFGAAERQARGLGLRWPNMRAPCLAPGSNFDLADQYPPSRSGEAHMPEVWFQYIAEVNGFCP